jgi:uncharacterized protein YcbK (DUF882 family)
MSFNTVQLTKDFSLAEFACHDGSETPAEVIPNLHELAKNLQALRAFFNKPIIILSGYRSPSWNKQVHGAPHSQHMLGKAADIICPAISMEALKSAIELEIKRGNMKQGGIGIYDTWVHYDIRGTEARWDLRSKKK